MIFSRVLLAKPRNSSGIWHVRAFSSESSTSSTQKRNPMAKAVLAIGASLTTLYVVAQVTNSPTQDPRLRKLRVFFDGVGRIRRSCGVGLALMYDYKQLEWSADRDSDEAWKAKHLRGAQRIVDLAMENGGLYVKLGQGFASLNHILPEEYCRTLEILQDKHFVPFRSSYLRFLIRRSAPASPANPQAPSKPFSEVQQIFVEDFGKPIDEQFAEFDEEPLAAASLAQVHRAVTKDGKEVAVKVQYLDIQDRFDGDMATMQFLFDAGNYFFPGFDFSWIISQARETLAKELDFTVEAANSEQCRKDLARLGHAYVPEVVRNLTSPRVLTTEFIHGCKITDSEGLKNLKVNLKDAAHAMVDIFAYQIFKTGFVHGDPHPGNMLIRRNKKGAAEVVVLDHGLYFHIEDDDRHKFAKLWKSIVVKDEEEIISTSQDFGVDDFKMFACLLFQRPYDDASVGFGSSLSEDQVLEMQRMARECMGEFVDIMKLLPQNLTFLLRNINCVRAINQELGAPVNRLSIMGRRALQGSVGKKTNAAFHTKMFTKAKFEFYLTRASFESWMQRKGISLMQAVGLMPKELGELEELFRAG